MSAIELQNISEVMALLIFAADGGHLPFST